MPYGCWMCILVIKLKFWHRLMSFGALKTELPSVFSEPFSPLLPSLSFPPCLAWRAGVRAVTRRHVCVYACVYTARTRVYTKTRTEYVEMGKNVFFFHHVWCTLSIYFFLFLVKRFSDVFFLFSFLSLSPYRHSVYTWTPAAGRFQLSS